MPASQSTEGGVIQLVVPAIYWDDYSDRQAVDEPDQMAVELKRAGSRVTISVNPIQLKYLQADALFYADGNTDDTPASVIRGAKRVVSICKGIQT